MSVAALLMNYFSKKSLVNMLTLEEMHLSSKIERAQKDLEGKTKLETKYNDYYTKYMDPEKKITHAVYGVDANSGDRSETIAKQYAEAMSGVDLDELEIELEELNDYSTALEVLSAGYDAALTMAEEEAKTLKERLGTAAAESYEIGGGGG